MQSSEDQARRYRVQAAIAAFLRAMERERLTVQTMSLGLAPPEYANFKVLATVAFAEYLTEPNGFRFDGVIIKPERKRR